MAVQASEIKLYGSSVVNDDVTNGNVMGNILIVSGVKNNIFPDVPDSERTSGSTKYRKVFWKVENVNNDSFDNIRVYMTKPTNGNDYVSWFVGNQVNVQNDITGSEREYGVGFLKNNISSGATSLVVTVEDSSLTDIFQNGDTIWIGDGVNEEFHENITVSSSGSDVTITLDSAAGDSINTNFSSSDTVVASCYVIASLKATYDNLTITSTAGTFDDVNYPILLEGTGAIEDTWTVTFTSATDFDVSGTLTGSVGSGSISSDFSPPNPNFAGFNYFTIQANAWGGTWAANDTLVFDTHPYAIPMWFKRVVPAGANTVYNIFAHSISGDSV